MLLFLLGNQVAIHHNSGSMGSSFIQEGILLMHKQKFVQATIELSQKFNSDNMSALLNKALSIPDTVLADVDIEYITQSILQSLFEFGRLSNEAAEILKIADVTEFYNPEKNNLHRLVTWLSSNPKKEIPNAVHKFRGIDFLKNVDVIALGNLHRSISTMANVAENSLGLKQPENPQGAVIKIVLETPHENWSIEELKRFFDFIEQATKNLAAGSGDDYQEPRIASVETGSLHFLWILQEFTLAMQNPEAIYYIGLVLSAYGGFNRFYISAQKRSKAKLDKEKAETAAASEKMDYFIKVTDLARDKTPAEQIQMFNDAVLFLADDNSPLAKKFKELAEQIQRQSNISQTISVEAPKSIPQLFLTAPEQEKGGESVG